MSKLSDHHSAQITKMLFIGDSGAGKTGALASLAQAGYNLRILDVDNGIDVLANLLRDKSRYGEEAIKRVEYETVTDKMVKRGDRLVPKTASVWQRVIGFVDNWGEQSLKEAQRRAREQNEDPTKVAISDDVARLKGIAEWTSQDVLVIDSLSMLSTAALNQILAMNARLGQQPHQSDWFHGQTLVEGFLQGLYDESVRANVIVIAHIKYLGDEGGPSHGYPNTLGKALPPIVGRYFNTALMAKTTGQGTMLKRKILTNTTGVVELKNTAPTRVKSEYPLETGLADYFKDVRGQ